MSYGGGVALIKLQRHKQRRMRPIKMIRSLYQLEDSSSHLGAGQPRSRVGGGVCVESVELRVGVGAGVRGSARWGVHGLLFDALETEGRMGEMLSGHSTTFRLLLGGAVASESASRSSANSMGALFVCQNVHRPFAFSFDCEVSVRILDFHTGPLQRSITACRLVVNRSWKTFSPLFATFCKNCGSDV